ncbi:hypothetical protein ADIS_3950 [Lunatimonas lonarensis]|uniref:Uncharacterized protein n=1 Tax=Lunatimonas lonarensis TaxID=1232681 RepID=R7ZN94_9BACT|nr:hypothetical protein [Lunatimonas lonarensis]EON75547.1 hypothetical protein ADIS_3950 [Lunatimonas lonarensis]
MENLMTISSLGCLLLPLLDFFPKYLFYYLSVRSQEKTKQFQIERNHDLETLKEINRHKEFLALKNEVNNGDPAKNERAYRLPLA